MTVNYVEILGSDGGNCPILPLERATRDALAKYAALRWPTGRRKAVEREWDLSPDEARGVTEASASASTIDKIWKHKRGGWAVLLPVMGAVIGHGLPEFIEQEKLRLRNERQAYEAREARLGQMARDLSASLHLGRRRPVEPPVRVAGEARSHRGGVGGEHGRGA